MDRSSYPAHIRVSRSSGICDSQSNKSHEKSETRKECVRMSAKEGVKSADQTNQ